MACVNTCVGGVKTNLILGTLRINPTGSIEYNQTVNISIDVTDHSLMVGGGVVIDVTNTFDGSCIYNENFWLPQGQTKIVNFQMTMPNDDANVRISASSWVIPMFPLLPYWRCEDVKEFSIKQKFVKYVCKNKQCFGPLKTGDFDSAEACAASGCTPPVPQLTDYNCVSGTCVGNIQTGLGQFANLKACTNSGCKAPIGGGTGITCPTGQTNLSGLLPKCYPQSDIYMGIAGVALLYMIIKK